MKDMEDNLGKTLFIRGNRKITLTGEGVILKKRAEEIIELVGRTENEIRNASDSIAGDVHIGAGETDSFRLVAKAMKTLRTTNPDIMFHISSGDAGYVFENLDKGLIDFGLTFGQVDSSKYEFIQTPLPDTWGILMPKTDPLAAKEIITKDDLIGIPLIVPRQMSRKVFEKSWFDQGRESGASSRLNIISTYTLLFNASIMIDEGLGYALCFDKLVNTDEHSNLCFRPLAPAFQMRLQIVWKKYPIMSKAAQKFLEMLQKAPL
jgi:DNA-binding transcriptional LysR family regulator